MSTIDRLRRLTGEEKPEQKKGADDLRIGELRRRIEQIMERRPARQMSSVVSHARPEAGDLREIAEGEEISTPYGKIFVAFDRIPAGHFHGLRRIGEIARLDMRKAAILAGHSVISRYNCGSALFIDTETTGLSGGTGTLAFLVGLGWYEGEHFIIRQLFARDFAEERALLSFLTETAKDKSFLVSFNGRAFDVGLLATRFILNRMDDSLSPLPHIDLLYPSRRILGHRLENCRLSTLEEEVLGVRRRNDIPGSEIPQRYFDWLRTRDVRLMADVLEHNRLDVISMASLIVHLCDLLSFHRVPEEIEHSDVLAAARLCLERGEENHSMCLYEALARVNNKAAALEAKKQLSMIHKRAGRWAEAVRLWEEMIECDPSHVFTLTELAKWCEHRAGDLNRAARFVLRALDSIGSEYPLQRELLLHRLERLRRRIKKREGEMAYSSSFTY
ncbi:MAG: ribonuclease H-like domain-containing protein [Syntrophales bacterium]